MHPTGFCVPMPLLFDRPTFRAHSGIRAQTWKEHFARIFAENAIKNHRTLVKSQLNDKQRRRRLEFVLAQRDSGHGADLS